MEKYFFIILKKKQINKYIAYHHAPNLLQIKPLRTPEATTVECFLTNPNGTWTVTFDLSCVVLAIMVINRCVGGLFVPVVVCVLISIKIHYHSAAGIPLQASRLIFHRSM